MGCNFIYFSNEMLKFTPTRFYDIVVFVELIYYRRKIYYDILAGRCWAKFIVPPSAIMINAFVQV